MANEIINETRAVTHIDQHKDHPELFTLASARLCNQIMREGKNLGSGILKVNSFVNHRVDVALMDLCGHALAQRFADYKVTVVLTAQTSGVLPAQACARYLACPMIFAREKRPVTMSDGVYESRSTSHTRRNDVSLFVASEYLTSNDRVLIVDDFLASGTTAIALLDIVKQAQSTCVGCAFLIEKSFEGGRRALLDASADLGAAPPIATLAYVSALEETGEIRLSGFRV